MAEKVKAGTYAHQKMINLKTFLDQGLANLSCRRPKTRSLRLCMSFSLWGRYSALLALVSTIQLSPHSTQAAMDDMWTNEHGCIPIKLYLQKQVVRLIWPAGYSFPIPVCTRWQRVDGSKTTHLCQREPQRMWKLSGKTWLLRSNRYCKGTGTRHGAEKAWTDWRSTYGTKYLSTRPSYCSSSAVTVL